MGPCGALASTVTDLATWSGFVADPDAPILSPDTLEEMCQPQLMVDPDGWGGAMGLGFFLMRSPAKRTWVGHTGGMPGQVTGVFTHRESGTGGIVLMNSSSSPDPAAFAIALGEHVLENDPAEAEPWRRGHVRARRPGPLLGRWFSEGSGFTFSVREGRLEARADAAPADRAPSVFERLDDSTFRTVSGRERGELLRVTHDADGAVVKLNWATYLVSRAPLGFGESARGLTPKVPGSVGLGGRSQPSGEPAQQGGLGGLELADRAPLVVVVGEVGVARAEVDRGDAHLGEPGHVGPPLLGDDRRRPSASTNALAAGRSSPGPGAGGVVEADES